MIPQPLLAKRKQDGQTIWRASAPAKLNLFLHVTGQRADGYHLLQTIFLFLDWCDELDFSIRADGEILLRSDIDELPMQQNLIYKAALALRQKTGTKLGCDIALKKNLPMGGGLGGGSSDAATTLVVLNELWGTSLTQTELRELGVSLGADVPVFIAGHACWAEGIGDSMQVLELPELWYLLIHPGVHVDTASVFRDPELTRNCSPIKISDFARNGGRNVCQPVVENRHSEVAQALDWLRRASVQISEPGDVPASVDGSVDGSSDPPAVSSRILVGKPQMSGTGSCVFMACENRQQALHLRRQFESDFPSATAKVAKGCNVSQLYFAQK